MVRLSRALVSRGHEVTVIFNKGRDENGTSMDLEREGIRVLFFPMDRLIPMAMLAFRREVKEGGYHVIHTHRDPALKFTFFSLLGLNIPLVAQRGSTYRPKGVMRWVLKSPRVVKVVAVARAVKDILIDYGLSPAKIEVVYGNVDPGEFHPAVEGRPVKEEFSIPLDAPVAGMVAALVGKKGYPIFLKAATIVHTEIPNAYFLMVGSGSPRKFRDLAEPLGDRAIFTGHRNDVPACIAAMDVVVCASTKGEGLTGSIREAMMMGKPVVSTAVSGNPEVIHQGETGLLVPPGDALALAEAVMELLEDSSLALSLGRRARERALSVFTEEKRVQEMERIYEEVMR